MKTFLNKLLILSLVLTVFTLNGIHILDNKDNGLQVIKTPLNQYYLYYQDEDVTIYHHITIDTNKVFLIPAGDVYIDLAYFDKKNGYNNFKVY